MKPSFKEIVKYIQKTAVIVPEALQYSPGKSVNVSQNNQGNISTKSSIRNMQEIIQKLSRMISSTIDYDTLFKSLNQPQNADRKQFEKSYGRDAFSNFMVNKYLRNASLHGIEYDQDPNKSKDSDKSPSELKSMFVILDTLNRIGNAKSEFKADGVWGQRTNNALKNIAAFAEAIMKLGKELNLQSKSFDVNKLSELKPLIPEKDTDISYQEKVNRASHIISLLNGIQTLFLDFKDQVLNNPNYRDFIEGEPLFKIGPVKKEDQYSSGEKTIYSDLESNKSNSKYVFYNGQKYAPATFSINLSKENLPVQYQNVKIEPFQITAADLISAQSFDQWVNSNSVLKDLKNQNPESWNNVAKMILQQIKDQITQKLGQSQPLEQRK